MKKAIIVTGTPGTGKTTVAKKLAKLLNADYVDVNQVIKTHELSEGYDRKRRCKIIDTKRLNKWLGKIIEKSKDFCVIDSHLSHYLPKEIVSKCIVTKCNLKLLSMRLKRRGYPTAKVKENLECEIFDICLTEAQDAGHDTIVIDTSKKADYESLIKKIMKK
jgi:adenylate kinase